MTTFWGVHQQNGYLGQWWLSDFTLTAEIMSTFPPAIAALPLVVQRSDVLRHLFNHRYNCAEQFMMMGKAALFADHNMLTKMSQEEDPKYHQKLGKSVSPFNAAVWDTYKLDIVKIGNYLKFSQFKKLNDLLLATQGSTLVEGSPVDKIWGVGIKFDDPRITNRSNWKGTNFLGICLEFVREILLSPQTDFKQDIVIVDMRAAQKQNRERKENPNITFTTITSTTTSTSNSTCNPFCGVIEWRELTDDRRSIIGKGFSSTISLKHWKKQPVAVKILDLSDPESREWLLEDFQREIRVYKTLPPSDVILTCHGYNSDAMFAWVVMEQATCSGRDFLKNSGNLAVGNVAQWIKILLDVASSVQFLHSHNFYHRDLTLENVLLLHEAAGQKFFRGKLSDFGGTMHVHDKPITFCGNRRFCAPEVRTTHNFLLLSNRLTYPAATLLHFIPHFSHYAGPASAACQAADHNFLLFSCRRLHVWLYGVRGAAWLGG